MAHKDYSRDTGKAGGPAARAVGKAHRDYSGTPLYKKLGIKEDSTVAAVGAPDGFDRLLQPLPPGAKLSARPGKSTDVIVVFATKEANLGTRFGKLADSLAPAGGLWVAYPKKSSGMATDLTFSGVQEIGLEAGLVDNKSCAIDDTWSGVRFVYRLRDRPAKD